METNLVRADRTRDPFQPVFTGTRGWISIVLSGILKVDLRLTDTATLHEKVMFVSGIVPAPLPAGF